MFLEKLILKNFDTNLLNKNSDFHNTLKKDLNFEQLIAVTNFQGNFLVIAGAGSGKTRVIIFRTLLLIDFKVIPKKILILTFSRKACLELRERFENYNLNEFPVIETFHSFAFKILKKFSQNKNFSITSSEELIENFPPPKILKNLRKDFLIEKL